MLQHFIDADGNDLFINMNDVSCVHIIAGESDTLDTQLYTIFITFRQGHSDGVSIRGDDAYDQILNTLRGEESA